MKGIKRSEELPPLRRGRWRYNPEKREVRRREVMDSEVQVYRPTAGEDVDNIKILVDFGDVVGAAGEVVDILEPNGEAQVGW